ncbi:MAG: hypothetical protein M3512_13935 [Bacteroidota bacterium]|nr:hypothetical protein [Bacteroidota bacterium]
MVFFFRLLEDVKEILNYTIFEENEADSIAIDNNTIEMVQIMYTNIGDYELGYINEFENITPVSSSPEKFLEALLIAAEMSSQIKKKIITFEPVDLLIRRRFAERCIAVSGGDKYKDFWLTFLTVW